MVHEEGRVFAKVKTVVLKELAIKYAEASYQNQFVNLVERILQIKKSKPLANITNFEHQIDQLVYQLYDLIEEEITIIEGN